MDKREFWEPWRPEIGQWVRVRLSAECNQSWFVTPIHAYGSNVLQLDRHPAALDGATGEVIRVVEDDGGHPYLVEFDEPVRIRLTARVAQSLHAALELEPLTDTQAAMGAEQGEGSR